MSYVRWSTILNSSMTIEEEIEHYKNGKDYFYVKEMKLKEEGAFISNWYIFWHVNGYSLKTESTSKEYQLLAIYYAGGETIVLDYEHVKSRYESDDWSILGDFDQKEVLINCVERWLKDVEKDCD